MIDTTLRLRISIEIIVNYDWRVYLYLRSKAYDSKIVGEQTKMGQWEFRVWTDVSRLRIIFAKNDFGVLTKIRRDLSSNYFLWKLR